MALIDKMKAQAQSMAERTPNQRWEEETRAGLEQIGTFGRHVALMVSQDSCKIRGDTGTYFLKKLKKKEGRKAVAERLLAADAAAAALLLISKDLFLRAQPQFDERTLREIERGLERLNRRIERGRKKTIRMSIVPLHSAEAVATVFDTVDPVAREENLSAEIEDYVKASGGYVTVSRQEMQRYLKRRANAHEVGRLILDRRSAVLAERERAEAAEKAKKARDLAVLQAMRNREKEEAALRRDREAKEAATDGLRKIQRNQETGYWEQEERVREERLASINPFREAEERARKERLAARSPREIRRDRERENDAYQREAEIQYLMRYGRSMYTNSNPE